MQMALKTDADLSAQGLEATEVERLKIYWEDEADTPSKHAGHARDARIARQLGMGPGYGLFAQHQTASHQANHTTVGQVGPDSETDSPHSECAHTGWDSEDDEGLH